MLDERPLDWRAFLALAAAFALAAWSVPRAGLGPYDTVAIGAGTVILLALGGLGIRNGQATGSVAPTVVGAVLVAAGALSALMLTGLGLYGPEVPWTVALAGAIAGIVLDQLLEMHAEGELPDQG